MRLVPLLPTLRGYRRSWLGPDLVAGMTLVAIAVPEQMATARLANMPALTGLYAFIAGSVMFALVGTHGQMSVGADSTIAPVFAAGVGAAVAVGTPAYAHLVTFCALLVGFVLIVVGCSRLGWIADFLSAPVVTGILAGLSVEITVRQLPAGLGIAGGGTTTADRLRTVVDQVRHLNGWTVTVTVTVVALALLGEAIDRRIPGPLLGLVVSIAAVILLGLKSHGVETVGAVHASLPAFGVSSIRLDDVRRIWVPALTVAFICVVQPPPPPRHPPANLAGPTTSIVT
jgi:MFS superfamily sulfate permease-like transporter